MDLRKIPFSGTRKAILSLLFGHESEAFYLRQIVRASGYGIGPVQRELKLLTEAGISRRTVRGRQVYFQANSESPIFPELKSLITKTVGIGDSIRAALASSTKDIRLALIYGSIARGDETSGSDIDLLIVGDVTFGDVVASLQRPTDAQQGDQSHGLFGHRIPREIEKKPSFPYVCHKRTPDHPDRGHE